MLRVASWRLAVGLLLALPVLAPAQDGHGAALRIEISVARRTLWVLRGGDTLLAAPVAVGMGTTLEHGARAWSFATPRGVRVVRRRERSPVWIPPDWLYAEAAARLHLRLARLRGDRPVRLADGRLLGVSEGVVGVIGADSVFDELPVGEHIIFDGTLYIPPFGTRNRRIEGALGAYRLDLGDGYYLHGTPDTASIGSAATHGCIRLRDDDIAWLYKHIPVGTRVEIR